MKSNNSITLIALAIAGIALLLAVIPPIVIDSKIDTLEKESVEYKKKYSIKIKDMEFGFSNGEKTENYHQNRETIEQLKNNEELFIISSLVVGFIALILAILSLIKKQDIKVGIGSIGVACVAIAWQYISAGITIGVAVFILLMLVANFGV